MWPSKQKSALIQPRTSCGKGLENGFSEEPRLWCLSVEQGAAIESQLARRIQAEYPLLSTQVWVQRHALHPAVPRSCFMLSDDMSLFPRLVLGWIEADFRVQIRILQHFSKSTRKENHLLASKFCKFLLKIWKFLQNFWHFWQILQNFAKFSEIRKIFAKFCRIFCRSSQKCVDFEKCWKMLYWMQKFMKILLKFDEILTKFWQNFDKILLGYGR